WWQRALISEPYPQWILVSKQCLHQYANSRTNATATIPGERKRPVKRADGLRRNRVKINAVLCRFIAVSDGLSDGRMILLGYDSQLHQQLSMHLIKQLKGNIKILPPITFFTPDPESDEEEGK
ncbi:unnamed protein product, partial [Rotaria magnacalcarata]